MPFIDELVATGAFPTAESVISEALRRLRDEQTKFDELKTTFDEAVAELERFHFRCGGSRSAESSFGTRVP